VLPGSARLRYCAGALRTWFRLAGDIDKELLNEELMYRDVAGRKTDSIPKRHSEKRPCRAPNDFADPRIRLQAAAADSRRRRDRRWPPAVEGGEEAGIGRSAGDPLRRMERGSGKGVPPRRESLCE